MLPVRFDSRSLLSAVSAWERAGEPDADGLTPIFVRNLVVPRIDSNGQLRFMPRNQEFILIGGVEAPLAEKDGWEGDYALCVNPAQWPAKPDENLGLLCSVDPSLPEKARNAMAAASEAGGARVQEAAHQAFVGMARGVHCGESLGLSNRGFCSSTTHGMVFKDQFGWGVYCNPPVRLEARKCRPGTDPGWSEFMGYYPAINVLGEVIEQAASLTLRTESVPNLDPTLYQVYLDEVRAKVEAAKVKAASDTGLPEFPEVRPLEKGYPVAKLPREIELNVGCARDIPRYISAKRMLQALGYTILGRELSSGSGNTRRSSWGLRGQVGPMEICPHITRVDHEMGILYVPAAKMGLVIGSGGTNIRHIEAMTGRKWKIQQQ